MPRGRQRYGKITSAVFASVIRAYLNSPPFQALKPATKTSYRRHLFLAEEVLGSIPIDEMRPALVQAFLEGLHDRPGTQLIARATLHALEKWAIVQDLLLRQITLGTTVRGSDGGHKPWSEQQVAYAESCVSPRLSRAIILAVNTGQRGSDLVRMRWTDLETHSGRQGINVVQMKTGVEVWVPLTQELTAAMATWERRPGFILLNQDGMPWQRKQLSNAWRRERKKHEPLCNLVLHGLRGTAVVRLRRAGCSIPEISAWVGMSEQMVRRYTRFSDQKENALAALVRLEDARAARKALK